MSRQTAKIHEDTAVYKVYRGQHQWLTTILSTHHIDYLSQHFTPSRHISHSMNQPELLTLTAPLYFCPYPCPEGVTH